MDKPKIRPPLSDPLRECVAIGECRPPHRSRKDTTRWCRGKEGQPHAWVWQSGKLHSSGPDGERGFRYEWEACSGCGRERRSWRVSRQRCHCGALMACQAPSARAVEKWGKKGAAQRNYQRAVCAECRYEPSVNILEHHVHGRWVKDRERTPCQCERDAQKAANRAKYQRAWQTDEQPEPFAVDGGPVSQPGPVEPSKP